MFRPVQQGRLRQASFSMELGEMSLYKGGVED